MSPRRVTSRVRVSRRWLAVAAMVGGAVAGVGTTGRAGAAYVITDLGTLGGADSMAGAINAGGLVVGCADDASSHQLAVAYDPIGGLRSLGTLSAGNVLDCAQGVSDGGRIVGSALSPGGFVAFSYLPETGMQALPLLATFVSHSARGVNDADQVVGWALGGGNPQTAVVWESGSVAPLPSLGGGTAAYAINGAGVAVGVSTPDVIQAVAWIKPAGSWVVTPLGAPPLGPDSFAGGINEAGTVVGQMGAIFPAGITHAFRWDAGVYTDLGVPAGRASSGAIAINAHDEIVGVAWNGLSSDLAAVVWRGGAPINLNDLIPADGGWVLRRAWDINDRGQIVGEGLIGGEEHGFMLSPDCNGNGRPDHEDIDGGPALDQSHTPEWEGNGVTGGVTGAGVHRDLAQTFAAGATARLLAVRLAVQRSGPNAIADGVAVPLEIVTVDGSGHPVAGDVLGGTTFASDLIPTGGTDLLTIDLSGAAIELTAGTSYAILMRAPDVVVGQIDWLTKFPGDYAQGTVLSRNDLGPWTVQVADALFETFIEVPGTSADRDGDGVPDECTCPADLDGSGHVGFADLILLLAAWGPCPPSCPADLDGTGDVGFSDIIVFLASWGPCA